MDSSLRNVLLVLACSFMVLLVFLVVVSFLAVRMLQRFVTPDVGEMTQKLNALRAANPGMHDEALVGKIIREQSLKCGIVGAITGIGGFITLPIALPIDILMSMRIQSAMVQFISAVYKGADVSADEMKLQTTLVMSGSVELTDATFNVIMRGVVRLLGESLSTVIPVIGALVGFLVNYGMAQATGNVAMRWYAAQYAKTQPLISRTVR